MLRPDLEGEHTKLTAVERYEPDELSSAVLLISRGVHNDLELAQTTGALDEGNTIAGHYGELQDAIKRLSSVSPPDFKIYTIADRTGVIGVAERFMNVVWGQSDDEKGNFSDPRGVKQGLLRVFVPRGAVDSVHCTTEALRLLAHDPETTLENASVIERPPVSSSMQIAYENAHMPVRQVGRFAVQRLDLLRHQGFSPTIVKGVTYEATSHFKIPGYVQPAPEDYDW
jgi:hypothetical protein